MRNLSYTFVLILSFLNINGQTISWINSGAGDENKYYNGVVDIGYSVISNDDEVYLTGLVTGKSEAIIQDSTIQNGQFCFLINYDTNGNLKWLKQLEGWGRTDVTLNSKNEVFVAGSTSFECYIIKYDKFGNLLWEKKILQNTVFPKPYAIAIDSKDDIYVCGSYKNSSDDFIVEDTLLQGFNHEKKAFIIKYDNEGNFKWFNSTNGGESTSFQDIKIDNDDNIVTIGHFETRNGDSISIGTSHVSSVIDLTSTYDIPTQDAIIAKYNSNGEFLWMNTVGGMKDDWGNKISINNQNEILMVGTFTDSAKIDNISFKSNGAYDIYLCKLSAKGDAVWVKTAGAPWSGSEEGKSIATDTDGNIFISGDVITGARFGHGENEVMVSSSDNSLIRMGFIAMYNKDGTFQWVRNITDGESTIEDIYYNNSTISLTGNFSHETQFLNMSIPVSYPNTINFFLALVNIDPVSKCETFQLNNDINIYPNPTDGILKINSSNSLDIINLNIINMNGEIVVSKNKIEYPILIDLSFLPDGIYILKTFTNNGLITKKVVKTKT